MKKILLGVAFAFVLVAPSVHAQEVTATPAIGGHRTAYVAGYVDSTNGKGAWLLSNYPVIGQILYVVEHPELKTQWQKTIDSLHLI